MHRCLWRGSFPASSLAWFKQRKCSIGLNQKDNPNFTGGEECFEMVIEKRFGKLRKGHLVLVFSK